MVSAGLPCDPAEPMVWSRRSIPPTCRCLMEHTVPHIFPHDHDAENRFAPPPGHRPSERIMLDELLRGYWERLVGYAATVLGSRDDAQDIAQEAFVRLWMHPDAMHSPDSAIAFLYRVTRNRALNERRRRLVRFRWRERELHEEPKHAVNESRAELHELEQAVADALNELSKRRREVFLLVRHHGLTHRQVGEALGLSQQTVANHMVSALEQLRVLLAPYLEQQSRPERAASVTSLLDRVAGQRSS